MAAALVHALREGDSVFSASRLNIHASTGGVTIDVSSDIATMTA